MKNISHRRLDPWARGSLAAFFGTAVAAALRWLLHPALGDTAQYNFFYAAVALAAAIGGTGPALLATLLGAFTGAWLFVWPHGQAPFGHLNDISGLIIFLGIGVFISLLSGRLHAARGRVQQENAERRQAEQRLREQNLFLNNVLESVTHPFYVIDARDYTIKMANSAARLGPLGNGTTCYELTHHSSLPCHLAGEACPLEHVRTSGQPYTVEHVHYDAEGNSRVCEVHAYPIVDTAGKVTQIIEYSLDVTTRKRAEEALRDSEERFRKIFEEGTLGMALAGLDARFVKVNAALCAMLGYTESELTRLTFRDVTHPEDLAETVRVSEKLLHGEIPSYELEKRYLRKNGSTVWGRINASIVRDRHGAPGYALAVIQDISRRRAAETHLAEQARLEQLRADVAEMLQRPGDTHTLLQAVASLLVQRLEAAFARVWTLDATGETLVLRASAGLYTHLDGAHAHIAVGQFKIGLIAQERRPHVTNQVPGDPRIHDQDWARREGMMAFAGYPLLLEDRLLGVVALFARHELSPASVTIIGAVSNLLAQALARKQAEEELEAARLSAESAKARAEQASRSKDHFLAVLSHELRTPLTPVLATVCMLQEAEHDPETRENLEIVRRNVELEARLIDDLLDLTRIARGKVQLDRQRIPLCEVIRRAVEVCKPDIEARQLNFGVDLGPAVPYWVEVDVARLQQVFWNLLKNAIKFTPPGGCVGIRCRLQAEAAVVVEINDTGAGIEPEALSRIFNAFEQGEISMARQFGGLGLGLAISKTLVEMHGGTIEAHSAGKGKGASFHVRLPVLHEAMPPAPAVSPANAAHGRHRAQRILLVEDHGDTAKAMKRLLERQGHDVQTAGDVATALRIASQQWVDLLISDLGLPDASGLELMRALHESRPDLKGIALSGYGMETDILRSREAGFTDHLTKPVDMKALQATIERVTM